MARNRGITTCLSKKDGANTAKSSRRSATFSASAISSWTPSSTVHRCHQGLFRQGFDPVPSAIDEAAITDKPADYDPIEAPAK